MSGLDRLRSGDYLKVISLTGGQEILTEVSRPKEKIYAHGSPFTVISTSPLTPEEKEILIEGLERFDAATLKILSQGRGEMEPPLKFQMSEYTQRNTKALADYWADSNILNLPFFSERENFHPKESRQEQLGILTHEVAHAIDDLGVIQIDRFGREFGFSSTNEFHGKSNADFPGEVIAFFFDQKYGSGGPEKELEVFAGTVAYLLDPQRVEKFRTVLKNNYGHECPVTYYAFGDGMKCLYTVEEFEAKNSSLNSFLNSVKTFLKNFPQTPVTILAEKGFRLPILRIKLW